MQKLAVLNVLLTLFLLPACKDSDVSLVDGPYLDKTILNSEYQKQGVSPEQWYYRMTVVDAPANSQALSVAEGHRLHPELIRFEITKDMLIGFRAFASVLDADREFHKGVARYYRGAPVVAFAIIEHVDLSSDAKPKPWYERQYIRVDWSKNLVAQLTRNDINEGVLSPLLDNEATYLIDNSWAAHPKRPRFNHQYIDFTTRHPVGASLAAKEGTYGLPFKDDTAASVIDIRHFFLKKTSSDFQPLYYPDNVALGSKQIAINKRFGFFRTGLDGRNIHNYKTGDASGGIVNATIFNIWQQTKTPDGQVIPIEQRTPKPIIYYTNVLHPENLMAASFRVASQWDLAFRTAVFHAQPKRYSSIDDVKPMYILRPNSCNLSHVSSWLNEKRPDLKAQVEHSARIQLSSVSDSLNTALDESNHLAFFERQSLEINAKRQLEQLCSALEFYTTNQNPSFTYQRAGDLRFNLLNLEVENNTTGWSGYGPMLADPLTGEIIAATANINLKYIDLRSQKMAKQIGLLKSKRPGLDAVFGLGMASEKAQSSHNLIDESALMEVHQRWFAFKDEADSLEKINFRVQKVFDQEHALGISRHEIKTLADVQKVENAQAESILSWPDFVTNNLNLKTKVTDGMKDPITFVDDISIGVAIKFAHLPLNERFLKIREMIYESVALHELGHNVGLRHNMAGASDPVNYGEHYWWTEQLPSNIKVAKSLVFDTEIIRRLNYCLDNMDRNSNGFDTINGNQVLTTQDCLEQKNGMYASIMDYHAGALMGTNGLGLYDKAAIKFAYGQVVEIFPAKNLAMDADKIDLAHWLRLNNFRHIPKLMLKNVAAINQREHVKFRWDSKDSIVFPNNAVPYAYCDDPFGQEGPRCLSFDFGPDLTSSARWLKSRYWQQYLLTHFAKNELWDRNKAIETIGSDINILDRFTHIMRWYHHYSQNDPDFKGSYAEQDYLRALAIGMNHFAHVLGSPEPGAHISAPTWTIEDKQSLPVSVNRLAPSNLLIPFNEINECAAQSITSKNSSGKISGRLGYQFIEIPLGLGRPFYPGFSNDIEDKFILYVGSSLVKKYALYLLAAPLLAKKSSAFMEKNDLLSMTWYRLFPDAVGKIYASVISKDYQQLGPIIADDGQVTPRDIIDEKNLKVIDYPNKKSIAPSMDNSLSIFAAENAIAFIPNTINQESNLLKSIKISCRGCSDDIDYADNDDERSTVHYHHWSGRKYKAAKYAQWVSVGARLLEQANRHQERYVKLSECLADEEARKNDPICQCVKVMDRRAFNEWACCDEKNHNCSEPILEPVGEGVCSIGDLQKRLEQSRDHLDVVVGFIDSLRQIIKKADI